MYNLYYHHQSNYRITSLRHVNGTFQRVDKLLCLQTLVISPPLLHRQGQEPIICLAAVKKPASSQQWQGQRAQCPPRPFLETWACKTLWQLASAGWGVSWPSSASPHQGPSWRRGQTGPGGRRDTSSGSPTELSQPELHQQTWIYIVGTFQFECLGSLNLWFNH